jgi:hypothetical protein
LNLIYFSTHIQLNAVTTPVLTHIFHYLPIEVLAEVRLVCHKWKDIVQQTPVEINEFEFNGKEINYAVMCKSFHNIVELRMSSSNINNLSSFQNPKNLKFLLISQFASIHQFVNLEQLWYLQ